MTKMTENTYPKTYAPEDPVSAEIKDIFNSETQTDSSQIMDLVEICNRRTPMVCELLQTHINDNCLPFNYTSIPTGEFEINKTTYRARQFTIDGDIYLMAVPADLNPGTPEFIKEIDTRYDWVRFARPELTLCDLQARATNPKHLKNLLGHNAQEVDEYMQDRNDQNAHFPVGRIFTYD